VERSENDFNIRSLAGAQKDRWIAFALDGWMEKLTKKDIEYDTSQSKQLKFQSKAKFKVSSC
jgi:hypothetical protein